jgi:hypothetical protein
MQHAHQIFLLILCILLIFLVFNTSAPLKDNNDNNYIVKPIKIDKDYSNIKRVTFKDEPEKREIPPIKHKKNKKDKKDKYKDWREHWLGRNIPVKSCYNNCQGLRKHEYVNCSEKCILKDNFGKIYN